MRVISRPRLELVAPNDVALFNNTTAAGGGGPNDTPKAERADYYDLGMEQKIGDAWTVGLDSFFDILKHSMKSMKSATARALAWARRNSAPGVASFWACRKRCNSQTDPGASPQTRASCSSSLRLSGSPPP